MATVALVAGLVALVLALASIRVLHPGQRLVVRRFGRIVGVREGRGVPLLSHGIAFLVPAIDRPTLVDLRPVTMNLPLNTGGGDDVEGSASLAFRIADPALAVSSPGVFEQAAEIAREGAWRPPDSESPAARRDWEQRFAARVGPEFMSIGLALDGVKLIAGSQYE